MVAFTSSAHYCFHCLTSPGNFRDYVMEFGFLHLSTFPYPHNSLILSQFFSDLHVSMVQLGLPVGRQDWVLYPCSVLLDSLMFSEQNSSLKSQKSKRRMFTSCHCFFMNQITMARFFLGYLALSFSDLFIVIFC